MKLVPHHARRHGLSLLEVLVALAIFLVSLIGIGQLISFGGDRAVDVQQQARATQLCQAKLAEVAAGAVPLSSSSSGTFDEDPQWEWSVESQQGNVAGLWTVSVHVSRQRPDGSRMESSLSQMVLDPSLRGGLASTSSASNSDTAASSAGTSSTSNNPDSASSGLTPGAATGAGAGANSPTSKSPSPSSGPSRGGK